MNWGHGAADQRCSTWGKSGPVWGSQVSGIDCGVGWVLCMGSYLVSMVCARGVFLPGSCSAASLPTTPRAWYRERHARVEAQISPPPNISIVVALAPFAPLIPHPLGFFAFHSAWELKDGSILLLFWSLQVAAAPAQRWDMFALKILLGIIIFLLKMLPSSQLKLLLLI